LASGRRARRGLALQTRGKQTKPAAAEKIRIMTIPRGARQAARYQAALRNQGGRPTL